MRTRWPLLLLSAFITISCGHLNTRHPQDRSNTCEMDQELSILISNLDRDSIQFISFAAGSDPPLIFERRIAVVGPPAAVALTRIGRADVLSALICQRLDSRRAFAAAVILAQLTRIGTRSVEAHANERDVWLQVSRDTSYDLWKSWLDKNLDHVSWDAEAHVFKSALPGYEGP